MSWCHDEWKVAQSLCGCRFPNMVVASISRSSVRRALLKGIGAEQIISFLKQHCHPQMYNMSSVIPRTVADQVSEYIYCSRKKLKRNMWFLPKIWLLSHFIEWKLKLGVKCINFIYLTFIYFLYRSSCGRWRGNAWNSLKESFIRTSCHSMILVYYQIMLPAMVS